MTKTSLLLKTISLIIIVAALVYYNQMAKLNSELVEANTKIEQYVSSSNSGGNSTVSSDSNYKDGTYSGTAQGYGGTVTTEIVIKKGMITGIDITSSDGEDAAYYNMCLGILDEIVKKQNADVDTVSGATYTSDGIINGAKQALKQACK